MTDITMPPRSLKAICASLGTNKADEFRSGDHLLISAGAWDSATRDERTIFINMARLYGLTYEIAMTAALIVRRPGAT